MPTHDPELRSGAHRAWPLERLKPYARNAKTHGADQVAKIAASMAQFGWTVPVLVAGDGEVIAGHGRILAAAELGLTEAPVIVLDHLTEEQRRAYRMADNKLTELGAWDEALLAGELQELLAEDVDLSMLGFSDAELDQLLAFDGSGEDAAGDDGEDIPEAPVDPVSRPGDLWLLGPHRLLCGDATVITDLDRLMAGRKADLCFTDSPYNVDYAGGVGAEKAGKGRRILNDALGDGFERFLYDACISIIAHTVRRDLHVHVVERAAHAAEGVRRRRRPLVDLHHLGEGPVHARALRLPAAVRADPLRLAGGREAPLVRRARPGRRLVHRPADEERPASDDEAGRPRRAGDPQLEPARRAGARPVRRQRHDADRGGADRAGGAAARARPEVRRRHRRTLAGRDRARRHAR